MPSREDDQTVSERKAANTHWMSLAVCVASAMFYCCSNTILRELTRLHADNDWTLFWKELTGLTILLPWLLYRLVQRRYRYISKRLILWLLVGATFCELVGSRLQMHAYMVVGILISAPIIQASTMSGAAFLGRVFLKDRLSFWKKVAMGVLLLAVFLLLLGKEMTGASSFRSMPGQTVVSATAMRTAATAEIGMPDEQVEGNHWLLFILAGIGAVFAGLSYSIHLVVIRYAGRRHWRDDLYGQWDGLRLRHWIGHDRMPRAKEHSGPRYYSPFPITLIMAIVLCVGVVSFAGCLYARRGWTGFIDQPILCWKLVAVSGCCNLAGFLLQVQGLRMTTASQVSLVAVSQFLFLALIGMCFFGEPTNAIIWTGIFLTVFGVLLSVKDGPRDSRRR